MLLVKIAAPCFRPFDRKKMGDGDKSVNEIIPLSKIE